MSDSSTQETSKSAVTGNLNDSKDETTPNSPTKSEITLFCEASPELISLLDSYCPKEYLVGIKSKLNTTLSRFEFQKVISFCQTLEKILIKRHQKRTPLTNFIATNSELYLSTFKDLESTKQFENFQLEDFDEDFHIKSSSDNQNNSSPIKNPNDKSSPVKEPEKMAPPDDTNHLSITSFTVKDEQKLSQDKAAKYVRVDFPGGKNCKTLLRTFLKQCENAIKLCKSDDLNLIYLNLTTHITGEAQVMLEDLNYDTWDNIVDALKIKYGEPETFSQRLYNFLTTAKIKPNESTADFGERISHLVSRSIESLSDEPKLKDGTVSDFLSHLGKIFFVEQGNPSIAQYLRLYYKDYSSDLQKLIRESSMEEQKLKGYGNTNRQRGFKTHISNNISSSDDPNKSPHANDPNNNRKNSKTGKWCYWHANDSHDTKDCRAAPTCEKCKFKGHIAADCRTKNQKVRKMEATTDSNPNRAIKPPTRPCRMCEKTGHYDSACPDLVAFKNFQAQSSNPTTNCADDGAEFTNVRMLKAKEVILRSLQTKSTNKDIYVKFVSPLWKRNFMIQLDGGAQVSIINQSVLPPTAKLITTEILLLSGVDSPSGINEKTRSLGYTYIPIKMNEKTVDVKFHVIKDNSLHFEKDGVLGGKLLDAAGTRIYYDLKIAKFMAFNATFNLIYLDPIESQTYKIMAIKCLNVSEIQEDLFSANKPPEGLIEADSLIEVKRVNVSESTPKIWKKKQNPVNPRCEILWANVRLNHLSQYEASFGFNLLWNCKDLSFLSEDSNQLQHSLVKTRFKSQEKCLN